MEEAKNIILTEREEIIKISVSSPFSKDEEFNKMTIRPVVIKKSPCFQAERFKNNQVFHLNMTSDEFSVFLEEILKKYGSPTPEAMVESGLYHISLLEKFDFDDIVLSLKSSNTQRMYDAYVLAAEKCPYPLHLGVTEAGTERMGIIKSSAGIGALLLRGIGGTIRVSLTDDPVLEVKAAKDLLKAIGMRNDGIKFVSCPTCGRTSIDLIGLAKAAEERFGNIDKNITVAIMGCAVNGPGEAREADLGIAGGDGCGLIFSRGEIIKKVDEANLLDALYEEIIKFGE